MVKVKGPVTPDLSRPTSVPNEAAPVPPHSEAVSKRATSPATSAAVSQEKNDELQREWKRLRDLPHKQILRGAASLFSGVFFPSNLLDVNDPRNDPKYMRLLAAVLGLDDLNDYFYTVDDEDKDEADEDEASAEAQASKGKPPRKRPARSFKKPQ